MQLIDKCYGISAACISMVHSYTGDQNLLDVKTPFSALQRSRSVTQNILPLESTATATLDSLFPHLRDKLYTKSIRAAVSATTLYDFTLHIENTAGRKELNDLFIDMSQGALCNIIGTDDTWKVSSDLVKNRHSATIDLPLREVLGGHSIKMMHGRIMNTVTPISLWRWQKSSFKKRFKVRRL